MTTIQTFLQQPEFSTGVLVGLILAILVWSFLALLRRQPDSFEAFRTESGKVVISKQALQDQIQRCCEELGDVGKARARVLQKKNILSIRIHLRIKSNAKLAGISGYVQDQISTVLRKNLGIENVVAIDIMVTGILPPSRDETTSIKPEEKLVE
jgi:uncharacterized alkaline shock family protein YloU